MHRPGLRFVVAILTIAQTALVRADGWDDARDAIASMEWKLAETRYADLAAASRRGTIDWTKATYAEAVAIQHGQPASKATIDRAAALFQSVIDSSADDRFIARSVMNLARFAELPDYPGDDIDLPGARRLYDRVKDRWPNDDIGSEAALRSGATLIMAFDAPAFEQVRAGVAQLRAWASQHPNNSYASVMWQYAGDTCFRTLNEPAQALDCYDAAARAGWADDTTLSALYWRCARIADQSLHDPRRAAAYYRALVAASPNARKASAATQEIARLEGSSPATHPSEARR